MVIAKILLAVSVGIGSAVAPTIFMRYTAPNESPRMVQVQAHRGGAGMHAESTLFAFAYAMDIGADVVEMDTLFTKDEIPVIWHDFAIEPDKCFDTEPGANYVGKFIANLTLAQIKTLDCGNQQSEGHTQARLYPGAQIQTLEEVLEFVRCYGDNHININLETKVDIRFPGWTLPVEFYVDRLVPIIKKHGMLERTILASFDWRSIVGIKHKFPEARVGALIDETLVGMIEGIWGMDWILAAHKLGSEVICPHHGSRNATGDAGGTVSQPDYVQFTTKKLVEQTHKLGMKIVPWTVDDESTIEKVIHDGVDGVISNYPLRVGCVARDLGYTAGVRTGVRRKQTSLKASCMAAAPLIAQNPR